MGWKKTLPKKVTDEDPVLTVVFQSQIFGTRTSKSRKPGAMWVCNLGDDFQCSLALKMGFCKPGRHDARMYSFCTKDQAEIGTVETGAED